MKQMSRRDARVKAYELVFMLNTSADLTYELEKLKEELKEHRKHMKYISNAVMAVCDNLSEIDLVIEKHLDENWSINRLSKMCIASLRLAIAEILYLEDIPDSVSINEAVEISKLYGDENEASFVNALLAKVAK